MGNLRALMLDPAFDKLPLADQTDVMRQAGAPDELLSEWVKRNAKGPMLSVSSGPAPQGFEDTSKEAAAILERYHEPNRARDVLPQLATFAALGSTAGLPAAAGAGMSALRGLSVAQKAAQVGKVGLKAAGYGVAGATANSALQAVGVPPGISEAVVAASGLSTKPGRAMVRAGLKSLMGERVLATEVPAVAAQAAQALPRNEAIRAAGKAAAESAMARGATVAEAQQAATEARLALIRGETAAPATSGATALAPEPATAAVAESAPSQADEIARKIVQWKTENKWSGAQIESALRNVYGIPPNQGRKMVQMVMEAQGAYSLQAPRIQVGAQKVGRSVGMTKEEVRRQAGPVLGEARGEASPILPKQALQSIIDTMRKIPVAEREAYVARATSGKAQWQVENIRRTLEHLGLLLPIGAVGAAAAASDGGA